MIQYKATLSLHVTPVGRGLVSLVPQDQGSPMPKIETAKKVEV